MRDNRQDLNNQEEKKEPNGPIQYEGNCHNLYWFMVSLNGKGTQFIAEDYAELREFTAKDLKLLNTDYHFLYKDQ